MKLDDGELKACAERPEILRALADWHDYQATCADAMDYGECVPVHDARRKELIAEAERIEKAYDR